MATNRLRINLELDRIYCHDEGDGWGDAEPYLWTVFFKVDGSTVVVAEDLTLSGQATIQTTPGSHGNLNDTDVDEGDNVTIPGAIGHFETILEPIPLSPPWDQLADPIGGLVGVIAVLMEEDNVSDDGAEAGHAALNNAVRDAINSIVATRSLTNQDVAEEEIANFTGSIESAVSDAIQAQQNFFENIWSWLNPDDSIGTEVFIFKHGDLENGGTIDFSKRWRNEGDWEFFGHVTSTVLCPADAIANLFAARSSARRMSEARAMSARQVIDISALATLREDSRSEEHVLKECAGTTPTGPILDLVALREFRDGPYRNYSGLRHWWALAQRNVPAVVDALLRHPELREPAATLCRFVSRFATDAGATMNEQVFAATRDLLLGLKRCGSRRLAIDASRALSVLPLLRGKNRAKVLENLSGIAPARHPALAGNAGARISKPAEVRSHEISVGFRKPKS